MSRQVVSLLVGILAKIQIYGMRAGGMTRYGQGWWHQKDSTLGHRSQSSEKETQLQREQGEGQRRTSIIKELVINQGNRHRYGQDWIDSHLLELV